MYNFEIEYHRLQLRMSQKNTNKVRIVIVDDHEIFLRGLSKLLLEFEEIEIQNTFLKGVDLLEYAPFENIDILLLDIQLPDIDPESLINSIRKINPILPVLYLTMIRGSRIIHRLEKHNIQGFILKDAPVEELLKAIKIVSGGGTYFSSEIIETKSFVQQNTATIPESKVSNILSPRECEILKLICQELSSSEIAERLFLSTGTVDTHRRNIMVKLGVNNTVGLVKFAFQNGLIHEN